MSNRRAVCAALALLALTVGLAPANAEVLGGRRLTWGGFGTVAADYSFAHNLEYRSNNGEPSDADPHRLEFATDSVAGLQVNAAWSPHLEAVVQVVSRNDAEHGWRPRLTRGFLRYVPDDSLMLRAGRIGDELFPHADSRDIGYSYLPVRLPVEMFGQLPHQEFDGADLTLTYPILAGLGRLKFYGGNVAGSLVQADGSHVNLSGSRLGGVQAQYFQGPLIGQLGVGWLLIDRLTSFAPLIAGLRSTGQRQAENLADQLEAGRRSVTIFSAALTYDGAPWQGRLYLARTYRSNITGPTVNMANLTLGRSFGVATPYVLLSRATNYSQVQSTGLPDTPRFAALNAAAYMAQTAGQTNQSTVAAGVRYDFAPKMDLKFQIDRVWEQGSPMVFDRNTPPRPRGNLTVFALAFDFVF